MTNAPTPKVSAVIIDDRDGETWGYFADAGPSLDPTTYDRAATHARLNAVFGIATYAERGELLDDAERTALLELGRLLEPGDFELGEEVEVHAFGHWYPGTVTKIGPKRITVDYVTGSGASHLKTVNPLEHQTRFGSLVRKANR